MYRLLAQLYTLPAHFMDDRHRVFTIQTAPDFTRTTLCWVLADVMCLCVTRRYCIETAARILNCLMYTGFRRLYATPCFKEIRVRIWTRKPS